MGNKCKKIYWVEEEINSRVKDPQQAPAPVRSGQDNSDNMRDEVEERTYPNLNQQVPKDTFSKYIFDNINKIRCNPKAFVPMVENGIANITTAHVKKNGSEEEKIIYKSTVKVALAKGKPAFEDAIASLLQAEPMAPLVFKEELCVPLPTTEDEVKDKLYLKKATDIMLQQNISFNSFWRDIVKDQETSFLLMIVDDTGKKTGMKRADILNPLYKSIGINSITIGKSFVTFVVFSE